MSKARLLLLDDDAGRLRLLRGRLRAEDYEVFTAVDGVQAQALVQSVGPDLVILQDGGPGSDGHELAAALREDTDTMLLPIVYLIPESASGNGARRPEPGVEIALAVPVPDEQLLDAVARLLAPSQDLVR